MFNDTQRREIFHFCFLQRLLKLTDPSLYVLKGGVNLRFFFNSPRYSEDMDLDVLAGSVATLKKNGYKILQDAAFARGLRTFGIEALDINDPEKAKHTETTQRFSLGLITNSGLRLPTKVEFSRRGNSSEEPIREKINPEIARQYRMLAYHCQHYPGEVAALQKIMALAGRPLTQARDVFDLYLLYAGGYVQDSLKSKKLTEKIKQQAVRATLSLTYENYQGQVLEFLDEQVAQEYSAKTCWDDMQETILRILGDV